MTDTNNTHGYANFYGWSDVKAHEVVRKVSAKTIEVRRLHAQLLNGFNSGAADELKFYPGGYAGHTEGHQRYEFTADESAEIIRIRLHKDGTWRDSGGGKYRLSDKPSEHYDFNF